MEKSLGGDRLGSGNKLKVHMHGYERSTHDLGYVFRSTMSAGTLVPFIKELALPGDTFEIHMNADVKTHPTVGPLFGSYKVQLDIFQCPIRLYHSWLHNNKQGIGREMYKVKLPNIEMKARNMYLIDDNGSPKLDIDNYQINPSCIFSYLGIRGVGSFQHITEPYKERYMCALAWLGYWDSVKTYYVNKQEEIAAVIHTGRDAVSENVDRILIGGTQLDHLTIVNPGLTLTPNQTIRIENTGGTQDTRNILILIQKPGTSQTEWIPFNTIATYVNTVGINQDYLYNNIYTIPGPAYAIAWAWAYTSEAGTPEIKVVTFPLENLDKIREDILTHNNAAPFTITDATYEPFGLPLQEPNVGDGMYALQSQEGLAVKTYQSDILNNWLNTEWIDGASGISSITAIDTQAGFFTIDTLLVSRKVFDVLNRVAVGGGSVEDWQVAVYDHKGYTKAYSPIYHGGLSKELVFQEVISQAATETEGKQPLGTLAGKGAMSKKHKGGHVVISNIDEASYILGIVSLTPRLDYSQGNDWDIHLETMDDLHKPGYDGLGFQEAITERFAWWDTNYNNTLSKWEQKSAGKQPAWINYMTNINRTRGNFAIKDNEMFMTLNRSYEANTATLGNIKIKDLTTYIDPSIYNQIFAVTALDSQNFWVQIAVDMEARRKMSAKLMPNL